MRERALPPGIARMARRPREEVALAADAWLHPRLLKRLVELDGAEDVAVVGERHRGHPELRSAAGEGMHGRSPIQEAIV